MTDTGFKHVSVMDTTLRDGQQSLWATRMTTPMMLPIAERLDNAGLEFLDLMGNVHFDVCVRFLHENPWQRIRLMRSRVRQTPLGMGFRSKSGVSFGLLPDDIIELYITKLLENGIGFLRVFDALLDLDNIVPMLRLVKQLGGTAMGALVFSESPVHTDALYAEKAAELIRRADVDYVMIKDSSGLLTPERVRTLVPALKAVMGRVPLTLHSHCLTGLAGAVYLEGVKLGVDNIQTSIAPLANGAAQPATQTVLRDLALLGYGSDVDLTVIEEVSDYLSSLAYSEGKPLGAPAEYSLFHYVHQMPGGMLSNFLAQLESVGLSDRYEDILIECGEVRRELGWPVMVTPFSQLVANQALLNVLHRERYSVVPDEVKMYALGHYGKLLAPVDPNILDRIVANGSATILEHPEALGPAVEPLRKQYPNATDEERLLRFMYVGHQVDEMLSAKSVQTEYRPSRDGLRAVVRELAQICAHGQSVDVRTGAFTVKALR